MSGSGSEAGGWLGSEGAVSLYKALLVQFCSASLVHFPAALDALSGKELGIPFYSTLVRSQMIRLATAMDG